MSYWFGLALILSGMLSLVFNEFTMRIRRVWPWRRDDDDAARDAQLNEYYRLSVYLGSVATIEVGQLIAQVSICHWLIRVLAYLIFGAWLLWRRPALRRKLFTCRSSIT